MNIGITLKKNAYTPEAYAYEKYLILKGHKVQLDYILDPNNDVNIYFMGLRPFWKEREGKAIEVHEYQSLSTPPYAKLKNFSKKVINTKPAGRIFLNNCVYQNLKFNDNIPYIYRDMGIDESLFQAPSDTPLYDIVYCGSVSGRKGLIEILINLSKKYKVVVVGKLTDNEKNLLNNKNITILSQVNRAELPDIYRNCRFGLNYTPNIYPFNIQTSTKTLEYLAAGLGVVSNKYEWSEMFFNHIKYIPIWLNSECDIDLKEVKSINKEIMKSYSWSSLLEDVCFDKFINEI